MSGGAGCESRPNAPKAALRHPIILMMDSAAFADRPAAPGLASWPRSTAAHLGILAGAFVLLLLLAPPAGEFPVDIDWNYTRVVQGLLERGQLDVSPWTATSLVFQVGWGSLFALLFGLSHTTLRISTLVLAAAGVVGFYLLLREFLTAPRALLGALLLLFNPLYVSLAYSFKTNVPFLALAIWALYCYGRGLRQPGPRLGWLLAGSALAGAAYLVRQIGIALPLAVLGLLLLRDGWRPAVRPHLLLAALGPFLLAIMIGLWIDQQRGPIKQEPVRWMLDFWRSEGPGLAGVLLSRLTGALLVLGLSTLPLALSGVGRSASGRSSVGRPGWRGYLAGGMLAALAGFAAVNWLAGRSPLFSASGLSISPRGFYVANRHYFSGTQPAGIIVPDWLLLLIGAAAVLSTLR